MALQWEPNLWELFISKELFKIDVLLKSDVWRAKAINTINYIGKLLKFDYKFDCKM